MFDHNNELIAMISAYNYFFMIEIIRTVCSIIPATHLQNTGISVPPYVFILKGSHTTKPQGRSTVTKNKKIQQAHPTMFEVDTIRSNFKCG